jgi:xylulokinase
LRITGGAAGTAKDPIWKYLWVKENEPEIFRKTYKWLDVKDYLTSRCTGEFKQTYGSAHLTWVFDTRPSRLKWSKSLCKTFGIDMNHLPEVVRSTDVIGNLTSKSASEMGLPEGIPVFGGGGDASMIPIGAGSVDLFDTHIYVGTSGWVVSIVKERWVDLQNFIASILNAIPDHYNYIAEQETAGLCLEWVRDHLALDEIGIYLDAKNVVDHDEKYDTLYDYLNETVNACEDGSGSVIFTPWLHGNRAPREDPYVRGMFFNIGLETGKRQMIRSVLEGVAYNMRWMLEACEKKIPYQKTIRMVGGGAKSDVWCQIMADVTGRTIETIDNPQNVGSAGAALSCAVGLGLIKTFSDVKKLIPIKSTFYPRKECKDVHKRNFSVFKKLYENNKKLYKILNEEL